MIYPRPNKRRLQVFAFDPAASLTLDTAVINRAVIELPWEKDWEGALQPGPVNDYLEVVDYDPGAGGFYPPVDLDDPSLLAQDGLPPAEGSPQFHQQMVFAVAMKTIRNFERALGRPVFWSIPSDDPRVRDARRSQLSIGNEDYPDFIKRLRIYPHALQARNAYFSPAKGALLFGYFRGEPRFAGHTGDWVFTCLSQDIIAHETTHAILHGLRRRGIEASNRDSLAFHEGFADIVALFQHFTMKNVVEHELGRTGGTLRSASLLTGLAGQFGEVTGRNGPLRSALRLLGREQQAIDDANPVKIETLRDAIEAHDRGQYLVAAVFDAFLNICERRTADLFAIAGHTPGDKGLPEKLIARLATEVASIAQSMLNMCVRGLDYLPPATTTFGDYLRAIVTADIDLVPDDNWNYRIALAESFRKREIPVEGCMSYAPSSLAWDPHDPNSIKRLATKEDGPTADANALFAGILKEMELVVSLGGASEVDEAEVPDRCTSGSHSARNLRDQAMHLVSRNGARLHRWLARPATNLAAERLWEELLGIRTLPLEATGGLSERRANPMSIKAKPLKVRRQGAATRKLWGAAFEPDTPPTTVLQPLFDVHSVRISRRVGPDGNELQQMIAQITQKRRGYFVKEDQDLADADPATLTAAEKRRRATLLTSTDTVGNPVERQPDFWFRGGATLIIDLRNGAIQHIIRQRIDDDDRLNEQRDFILGDDTALAMTAMTNATDARWQLETSDAAAAPAAVVGLESEPFAFLHADHA
jgi:hypothetical protein